MIFGWAKVETQLEIVRKTDAGAHQSFTGKAQPIKGAIKLL